MQVRLIRATGLTKEEDTGEPIMLTTSILTASLFALALLLALVIPGLQF